MFFDAEQTWEAVQEVEQPRIVRAASRNGGLLIPLIVGILIGRKSK